MFDALKFASDTGQSLSSMVSQSASGLTSSLGNFVNNLSGSGMSISSIKNVAANKLDSATNFLNGDPSFSRISQQSLALMRSKSIDTDPIKTVLKSQEGQNTVFDKYPLSLGDYFIRIEFSKYDRPGPMSPAKFNTLYTVHLPLPKDISETHSIQLDPQETGLLTSLMSNAKSLGNVIGGLASGDVGKFDTTQLANQGLGLAFQGVKTFASGINVAGISGEQVVGMAGQYMGAVPNPHISVFFNGVDIRPPMEFSWLLSARNERESNIIKNIIKEFKKRVLPTVTPGDQNIMGYPQMVKLSLHPWNGGLTNSADWTGTMPIYKVGLINSINVNYSPEGLSFFKDVDSSPVFVVFSFTFQELEVWTANDYGSKDAPNPAGEIKEGFDKAKSAIMSKFSG